jgi:AcrR family transcriptional regulator
MEATGLGKGSIYKAFGNKHALYVRVFSDYCQDLVAQAREELRDGPHAVLTSPMARLERYVVSLADGWDAWKLSFIYRMQSLPRSVPS